MTSPRSRTWLALVMIGVGALALVGNVGWFGPRSGWAWGIGFALVGAAFLALYARERGLWWALFPGFAALGLAAAAVAGSLGGALFLALAGAAFVAVYLTDRRRAWAVIPGGVLATLALMALLEAISPRIATDWLLFTGLAATFAAVYLGPREARSGQPLPYGARSEAARPNWALQAALGLVGLAIVAAITGRVIGTLVALALIALGGVLAWRAGGWVEATPPAAARSPVAGAGAAAAERTAGAPDRVEPGAAGSDAGPAPRRGFSLRRRAGR